MREFGICNIREFDLLDERALTDEEMRRMLYNVLGGRQEVENFSIVSLFNLSLTFL